jgi:hypothetical protein
MKDKLKVGVLIHVKSESIDNNYTITEVTDDGEGGITIYDLHWEGPENPDIEPEDYLSVGPDGQFMVEFGNMEEAEVTIVKEN